MRYSKKSIIALHHSAIDSNVINPQYDAIRHGHKQRFGRDDMEYHALIERDGTIEYHPEGWDAITYHAGEWNELAVGICLAGNFLFEQPTLKQWDSLIYLIGELKITDIRNHNQLRRTICPKIDLVGHYYKELDRRWYDPDKVTTLRIASLRRGIGRAKGTTLRLLQRQLGRLTNRLHKLECCS